jgi:hypothetical protein
LNNFEKKLTKSKLNTLDKLGCNLDIVGKPLMRGFLGGGFVIIGYKCKIYRI